MRTSVPINFVTTNLKFLAAFLLGSSVAGSEDFKSSCRRSSHALMGGRTLLPSSRSAVLSLEVKKRVLKFGGYTRSIFTHSAFPAIMKTYIILIKFEVKEQYLLCFHPRASEPPFVGSFLSPRH